MSHILLSFITINHKSLHDNCRSQKFLGSVCFATIPSVIVPRKDLVEFCVC